jgi:lysine biosynthesis protein LysW
MATCPECDAEIVVDDDDLDEMEVGDPWDCDACGSHLRVVTVEPLDFEGDEDADDEDLEEEGAEKAAEDDDVDFEDDDDDDADDDAGDWEE